jgi:hypothetical protein
MKTVYQLQILWNPLFTGLTKNPKVEAKEFFNEGV